MTQKQINKAIKFIDRAFDDMPLSEADNFMAGDGFYSIFEEAIDQAFDTPEEAANWWYSSDPMISKDYEKIHDHYIKAHAKMWKRLHPEEYSHKTTTRKIKAIVLKTAKTHFKQYPNGSIEIYYTKPIPGSGETATLCYDYKTFKFELKYAMSQNADIASIVLKY